MGLSNIEECNLVSRSYTNLGLGYTINNEKTNKLYKNENIGFTTQNQVFFVNEKAPRKMRSASLDHSLRVMVERSSEELDYYEKKGEEGLKPKTQTVVLHNPQEPANMISNSFTVPLGHTTIVYIRPHAQQMEKSAEDLTEAQRGCRLNTKTQNLGIFNVYTKESCLFECDLSYAYKICGCFPWNYPITKELQII